MSILKKYKQNNMELEVIDKNIFIKERNDAERIMLRGLNKIMMKSFIYFIPFMLAIAGGFGFTLLVYSILFVAPLCLLFLSLEERMIKDLSNEKKYKINLAQEKISDIRNFTILITIAFLYVYFGDQLEFTKALINEIYTLLFLLIFSLSFIDNFIGLTKKIAFYKATKDIDFDEVYSEKEARLNYKQRMLEQIINNKDLLMEVYRNNHKDFKSEKDEIMLAFKERSFEVTNMDENELLINNHFNQEEIENV